MALQNRRRSALSEIPIQMSQLRVSTDEAPNVLHRTVIDSPLDNIPLGYLTPSPSQDEIVIRQRGRRRIAINWSPEKTPTSGSLLRTPNKPTTTMTLRSSPRKRLYVPDGSTPGSPLAVERNNNISSPQRTNTSNRFLNSLSTPYSPQTKKSRTVYTPIAQINAKTPLTKLLKGLSNAQLINIIQGLTNNEAGLEEKVRANLPIPDILPLEEQLIILKKNIFRSLPTSRLMKNTDSAAHTRVATHLAAFKKAVVEQSRQLNDSENWDALLDYSIIAWNYVRSTPVWENNSHNASRRSCFKILAWHCNCALKSAGILLGEQRLTEFYSQIESMKNDCDDISICHPYLDEIIGKLHSSFTSPQD